MWVWWRVIAFLVSNGGGEYRDEQALRKQPSKQSEKKSRSLFASHVSFCLGAKGLEMGKKARKWWDGMFRTEGGGIYRRGLKESEVTSYRWKSVWLVAVLLVHLFILLAAFNCFK